MLNENSLYRFLVPLNHLFLVDEQETGLLYPGDWGLGDGLDTTAAL